MLANANNPAPLDWYGGHATLQFVYHFHAIPTAYFTCASGWDATNHVWAPAAPDGQHSPLIGWALDGFPVYGPYTTGGVVPVVGGPAAAGRFIIMHATSTTARRTRSWAATRARRPCSRARRPRRRQPRAPRAAAPWAAAAVGQVVAMSARRVAVAAAARRAEAEAARAASLRRCCRAR